jgi:hypothetical protein
MYVVVIDVNPAFWFSTFISDKLIVRLYASVHKEVRYPKPYDEILRHQFDKRLLYAIHSPAYWRILKKTIVFYGFKNTNRKIRETKKPETRKPKSIHE